MINEEELRGESAWEEYTKGSMRLSRMELSVLWALTKINLNGNFGKQFQYHYISCGKSQNLASRTQKSVLDLFLENQGAYTKVLASLKKDSKFNFLTKTEELLKKVVCYQAVFSIEGSPSIGDSSKIKDSVIRLGMLEEYEDFVILYPPVVNDNYQTPSAAQKQTEERAGIVFWKKHEKVYLSSLTKLIQSYFETIGPERSVLQLSDLLQLIVFALSALISEINDEANTGIVSDITSVNSMVSALLMELEEAGLTSLSGDFINKVRSSVDLIKLNISNFSKKIRSEERDRLRAIGGMQFLLTDSLKNFINKESTTSIYFPAQKVISKFSEYFSKRNQQEWLPEIMPDMHQINKQAIIYAPFTIAYINSGSLYCLMIPEPEQLLFGLKFYSTKTGSYRDDNNLTLGVTKTVAPYSEKAVSTNRRSKDSLITRKSGEIMSPFDIRADNKEGVLLLNVSNKGHSPVYVYLFAPGDFLPGEFSDRQTATALWKRIIGDHPSFNPSQKTKKKIDDLSEKIQEPVLPVAEPPAIFTHGNESDSSHPWRKKMEPCQLEFGAFKFHGSRKSQPVIPPPAIEIKKETITNVTSNTYRDELSSIILLNDFIYNQAGNSSDSIQNDNFGTLLRKMNVRKEIENKYPELCPRSNVEYLLRNISEKKI
ncbi:hypothetical protein CCP3SC1_120016 [Gammaproteobacteria bacterium]